MPEYVFAYGTLRQGLAPPEVASVVEKLRPVGEGWASGALYDLGAYPGAVFNETPPRKIHGIVYELPNDAQSLKQLDQYEGPEYRRIEQQVRLDAGGALACWVYDYLGRPGEDRLIESGRWTERRERQSAA